MAMARVYCDCGFHSHIPTRAVTVLPELRAYRFVCPHCDRLTVRICHPSVVYALLDLVERGELAVAHVDPPQTEANVDLPPVRFGEWLEAHDNLDAWLAFQLGRPA